jgi:hypothetical protein
MYLAFVITSVIQKGIMQAEYLAFSSTVIAVGFCIITCLFGPSIGSVKRQHPYFFPVITGNIAHQAADCAAVIPDRFYSTYALAKQI